MEIKRNAVIVTVTPYTQVADAYLGGVIADYPEQTVEGWHDMDVLIIADESDTLAGNLQVAVREVRYRLGMHGWKAIKAIRELARFRARLGKAYMDPGCEVVVDVEQGDDGHYSIQN